MEIISAHSVPLKCNNESTHPNLQEQYLQWLSDNELHPSFQLLPNIFKIIGLRDNNVRSIRGKFHSSGNGNRQCTQTLKNDSENINERSLCPYYFLLNHDPNRYPSIINTARCRCDTITNLPSNLRKRGKRRRTCKRRCKNNFAEEDIHSPKCTEVPYRYKVLKQKYNSDGNRLCDEKNNFIYVETYETVGIACIPVIPKADVVSTNKKVAIES